jgi:hypothetical protein
MTVEAWNPWKMTAIGMALVLATAAITGIVVANWSGRDAEKVATDPVRAAAPHGAAAPRVAAVPNVAPAAPASQPVAAVPPPAAVEACNQYAATTRDKTIQVVKDGAIGTAIGAVVGAAGGAIAGGGKGAGKGAVIGGLVGAGGGALYGVNQNRVHDEQYRAAYASCLRARGYGS